MYPTGTRFNDWCVVSEKRGKKHVACVRRWVIYPPGPDGKSRKEFERYTPTSAYKDIRDNPIALQDFVIRLNNRLPAAERTKRAVEIKHAFNRPALVEDFISNLKSNITERDATVLGNYLKKYCLQFFTVKLGLPDPLQWHKQQSIWAQALLNDFSRDEISRRGPEGIAALRMWPEHTIPADSTLKKIVQVTNEYLSWLHQQRPEEYPPLTMRPIKRQRYRTLRATRKASGLVRVKRYIPDVDWEKISEALKGTDIEAHCHLAYLAGLRQAETLTIDTESVLQDNLHVKWQLLAFPEGEKVKGVVKGRNDRRVPFWNAPAREFFKWAELSAQHGMHPDTLGSKWRRLMQRLKLPYEFHDLRRTFITNGFRDNYPPGDIQLAAGHTSISTTMKYKLDHRAFSDKKYNPKYDLISEED